MFRGISILLGIGIAVIAIALLSLAIFLASGTDTAEADQRTKALVLATYSAFETATPEQRVELVESLNKQIKAFEFITVEEPVPDPVAPVISKATVEFINFRVDEAVELDLPLSDGNLLRYNGAFQDADRSNLWLLVASLTIALTLTVLLWAATRYMSPVQKVVQAADQLSLERELSPIDEATGPTLARDAAKAFNRMQSRIREYLGERSLMIHALHHDLRHGMFKLQMRMEQVDDEAIKDKSLRDINDLLEILEEVLAFADTDLGPDRRQNIRVNSIVFGAVDTWVDQGRAIEVDLTGPHTVLANQTRLKRVIGNLVGNAMNYADGLWITSVPSEDSYTLVFDDDGSGIPEHERTRVLQPFQRLDKSRNRSSGGTGLGLAIVKRSIDRDQGSVRLLDSPKGGLRVELVLARPNQEPQP